MMSLTSDTIVSACITIKAIWMLTLPKIKVPHTFVESVCILLQFVLMPIYPHAN